MAGCLLARLTARAHLPDVASGNGKPPGWIASRSGQAGTDGSDRCGRCSTGRRLQGRGNHPQGQSRNPADSTHGVATPQGQAAALPASDGFATPPGMAQPVGTAGKRGHQASDPAKGRGRGRKATPGPPADPAPARAPGDSAAAHLRTRQGRQAPAARQVHTPVRVGSAAMPAPFAFQLLLLHACLRVPPATGPQQPRLPTGTRQVAPPPRRTEPASLVLRPLPA